jgi:hypothetical protein
LPLPQGGAALIFFFTRSAFKSRKQPHPFFCTSFVAFGIMNVLPSGRIMTVPMTEGERRAGHLLRVWMMLRKSPFCLKQLKAMKAKKAMMKAKKAAQIRRVLRERRIQAAMRMSKRQLAEELVLLHDCINGLEKRMDEQVLENQVLRREIQTFEQDYTRRNTEFSRHILHISDNTMSLVEDLMQNINRIERRLPASPLFGEADE